MRDECGYSLANDFPYPEINDNKSPPVSPANSHRVRSLSGALARLYEAVMAKRKAQTKIRQYSVPMTWTHRGHAIVTAADEYAAVAKAKAGQFCDGVELQENTAELVDWEVDGYAKLDD